MNACNIKKEELTLYCYGELCPKRMGEIKNHLTACRRCAEEAQRLEKTIELFEQQKLKTIPKDILDNYTQGIREQLATCGRKSLVPTFKEKLFAWLESLRPGFRPRALVPALAVVCAAIFVFTFLQYGKINNINLVNRDIALLDALGEDVDDIYSASDEARLAEEIKNSDHIMLAELEKETDSDDILYNAALLEELGEKPDNNGDIDEEFQAIDDLELGSAVG